MTSTSNRLTGSAQVEAFSSSDEYSMYSVIRCRKLRGSLKITGMVILDSSCKTCKHRPSSYTYKISCLFFAATVKSLCSCKCTHIRHTTYQCAHIRQRSSRHNRVMHSYSSEPSVHPLQHLRGRRMVIVVTHLANTLPEECPNAEIVS